MTDASLCAGCYNDVYNGQLARECWNLPSATLESRLLIHVDLAPPYLHLKPRKVPSCYKMQRYVTVNPDAIDKQGYWKR